jgi:hypothetical protein
MTFCSFVTVVHILFVPAYKAANDGNMKYLQKCDGKPISKRKLKAEIEV